MCAFVVKKDVEIPAIAAEAETLVILAGMAMRQPAPPTERSVTTLPAASPMQLQQITITSADTTTIAVQVIASHYTSIRFR